MIHVSTGEAGTWTTNKHHHIFYREGKNFCISVVPMQNKTATVLGLGINQNQDVYGVYIKLLLFVLCDWFGYESSVLIQTV